MRCFIETIFNTKKSTAISFPPIKCGLLGWFLTILGVRALSGYVERPFGTVERQTQAPIQT